MNGSFKVVFDPAKPHEVQLEIDGRNALADHPEITRVTYETDGCESTLTISMDLVKGHAEGYADIRLAGADGEFLKKLGWCPPDGGGFA